MLNEKEMDYWKRKDTQIKTPFTYAYSEGWSNMWEYAYPLNYMLLLMLAICLSNIFSIEYVRKQMQLSCAVGTEKHNYIMQKSLQELFLE